MKIKHTQLSRYLCPVLGCREFRYRGHRRFCPAHWVELPESVRGEIDRLGKAMKDCPDDYRALSLQKTCNQWRRGVIPNPDTWLRERRWEDEPEKPSDPPPDPPPGWKRPTVSMPRQPPPEIPPEAADRAGEWEGIQERLVETVDPDSFEAWISPTRCLGRTDREIWLAAPTLLHRSRLIGGFEEAILAASGARRAHYLVAEIAEEVEA